MLTKIQLYGELGKEFGKEWFLDIYSPAEALRGISANNKSFIKYLANIDQYYEIRVGSDNYSLTQISNPAFGNTIKIIPVVGGSKKGGLGKLIFGALMIWGAWNFAPAIGGEAAWGETVGGTEWLFGGFSYGDVAKFGLGLALQGAAQMLAPQPKTPETITADNAPSYYFDGPVSTSRQGLPVPVCYGRMIAGAAVISAGVFSEDYVP
jgi:predicted phage tail protein